MSPNSLRWKYRALRLAITAGCVSSLQLAGCLNNPTRSDLASEAGKAALVAEEDISHQKIEAAEKLAATEAVPRAGKIVLAGGDTPDHDEGSRIVQTAGEVEEAPPKKSFWSFLMPKPKKPVVKDPFADHPELKAQAKNDAGPEAPQASPGKARLASSSVAVPDAKVPEKDAYSPEHWFEKELANQPAPSWAPVGENKIMAGKPGPFDRTSPFDKADKAAIDSAKSAQDTAWNPQKPNAPHPATQPETDDWAAANSSRSREPAAPSNPVGTNSSMNHLAARQQKLRIQALMSEAHTCALRGELHAAYRCALLAEKIAEENRLTFASGEETPQEYARSLAAKLWRTSNASEESYLAATETAASTTSLPDRPVAAASQGPQSRVVANSPFPNGNFATWQPLKDRPHEPRPGDAGQEGLTPAHLEQTPSAASGLRMASAAGNSPVLQQRPAPVADLLPEIRPWPNERAVPQTAPPREFSSSTAMTPSGPGEATQRPHSEAGDQQQSPSGDRKVQFAIAQEVQEEQSPALFDPFSPSETTGPRGHLESGAGPRQLASAAAGHQRPVLLAPPVPAEHSPQSAVDSTLTWEQISRSRKGDQKVKTADSGWNWRAPWSLLGLLAAGLSTGAGIWYSRRSLEKAAEDEPAITPAQEPARAATAVSNLEIETDSGTAGDEPEIQPLQFKRAA